MMLGSSLPTSSTVAAPLHATAVAFCRLSSPSSRFYMRPSWPFTGYRRRRQPQLRLRPVPAHRQRHRHLPRPLHLLRQPRATSAPSTPRRLAPQPSWSPPLLAPSTWRTACTGPRLRMPGAGNTDVCLRPRRVPGLGNPGAAPRQHRLTSVYACPVLAIPTRAFVHDVSPGLANLARCLVHIIFYLAHHCALTTRRSLAP